MCLTGTRPSLSPEESEPRDWRSCADPIDCEELCRMVGLLPNAEGILRLCQLLWRQPNPVQPLTHLVKRSAAFAWLLNRMRCVSVKTRYSFFFRNILLLVWTSPWCSTVLGWALEDSMSPQANDGALVEVVDMGVSSSPLDLMDRREPKTDDVGR